MSALRVVYKKKIIVVTIISLSTLLLLGFVIRSSSETNFIDNPLLDSKKPDENITRQIKFPRGNPSWATPQLHLMLKASSTQFNFSLDPNVIIKKIGGNGQIILVCEEHVSSDVSCILWAFVRQQDLFVSMDFNPDAPDQAIILSPDMNKVALVSEKEILVYELTVESMVLVKTINAPAEETFGAISEFPSFHPKGRWLNDELIEINIYDSKLNYPYPRVSPKSIRTFKI